jgi:murein DD-endopeptidase MepM/ murein hydrolase activator NlpD
MFISLRLFPLGALALIASLSHPALAAKPQVARITAAPGTLVRWAAPGTTRCSMKGHSWAALKDVCYYPVDLLQTPGPITVARINHGKKELAIVSVEAFDYGTEKIDLPDIPQGNPSAADFKRNTLDRARLAKVWNRKVGPPKFTLPLGVPAAPLPKGKSFGVTRFFNGKQDSQPHMGADYLTPVGTPVLAVADGTVVIAEDLFYEGNAVFIDHGDDLISMYFHLSEIKVKAGQEVKKGATLGRVGSTGRSTGPHLFFGVRWRNARIDPKFLFEDPGKIPTVGHVAQ